MRLISNKYPLYRGKSMESGEWVYGVPFEGLDNVSYILPKDNYQGKVTEVYSNTLGESTGITLEVSPDEIEEPYNHIYEGDILKIVGLHDVRFGIVLRHNNSLCIDCNQESNVYIVEVLEGTHFYRVGNIFDNFETASSMAELSGFTIDRFTISPFLYADNYTMADGFRKWCGEVKLDFQKDCRGSLYDYLLLPPNRYREDNFKSVLVARFPHSTLLWLYKHCPIEWVRMRISKDMYPGFKLPDETEYYGTECKQ